MAPRSSQDWAASIKPTTLAVVLCICLGNGLAIAGEPAQASIDSIGALLAERDFDAAVELSRGLVDRLRLEDARGADLARGLEALARSLRRRGKFRDPETLEIASEAVAACSASPVANPDLKAACLNTLGLIHYQRSAYEAALPLFEEATGLWSASRGHDDQKVAAGLNNQGLVLEALGRNDQARTAFERAALIYEARRAEPEYLIKLARTTMSVAKLHLKLGHYDQARDWGERGLEIFASAPGGNHPRLGSAMGDLAALYRTMGDLDRAETLYEAAVPRLEAAYGPDHSEVGRILNNLGNLRADRGDIAAARNCFERALAITEQARGPDDPQTGVRLLNLASILADLGDADLAITYLTRAEEIFQTRLGPDHLYTGFAKHSLGPILAANGEPEAGLSRLLEARTILEAQLGTSHLAVAEVLRDIGGILMDLGRYPAAEDALARSLSIVRTELGPGHPEVARILHAQGRLALLEGDAARAEISISAALATAENALGPDHPELAAIHLDLARALADLDRLPVAFDHALLAESIGRNSFALAAVAFEERRALQFARRRTSGLGLAATLALELQETGAESRAPARLWDELVRSRRLVLDLMGARQRYQHQAAAPPALVDSSRAATRELANLFVRGVGEDSPAVYREALTASRIRREDLERRLAATSLDFARRVAITRAGFAAVAAELEPGDCLVSFLTCSPGRNAEPGLAALIHRPGRTAPELLFLAPTTTVENAVATWRQTFTAGILADGEDLPAVTAACRQAGRHLAELIWDPLGLDQAPGRIYIVPDGPLTFVDFQALPRQEAGYMIENDAVLSLVSAERDLLIPAHPAAKRTGLLVMGGMEFGIREEVRDAEGVATACRDFRDLCFAPLPGTRHEARTVADMWSKSADGPVRRLVGADAGEGAFKAIAGDYAVIHLATHGFFLVNDCRSSADLVHPLLLAGLAFSGANEESVECDAEDGILTAYEVAALDLSGVEVAVLSACDTGQGEILAGEGVFGLQRAFAMAGTRSLIMSLWPVDDGVAATWMEHLYRNHLLAGMDFSLAARQASRKMLLEQRARGWPEHPFTWSPFVRIRTGS